MCRRQSPQRSPQDLHLSSQKAGDRPERRQKPEGQPFSRLSPGSADTSLRDDDVEADRVNDIRRVRAVPSNDLEVIDRAVDVRDSAPPHGHEPDDGR
jgi:hypothetical protein